MGKGSIGKQAALRRKMEQAKRQKLENSAEKSPQAAKEKARLTDKEIKERNDRLRFEELLKTKSSTVLNDYSADGYLNKQQEEEEITAAQLGVDRIFEGDPAPVDCFEELVNIVSENPIGSRGKERLVPWLRRNADGRNDYLVVLSDPRGKSFELQQTVKNIQAEIPSDIRSRLIVINADRPAENRRFLKKSGLDGKVELYSDEKMEWMRSYSALGDKRWSMTMFVIAEERVQKLARELDQYGATRAIRNAVKSLKS